MYLMLFDMLFRLYNSLYNQIEKNLLFIIMATVKPTTYISAEVKPTIPEMVKCFPNYHAIDYILGSIYPVLLGWARSGHNYQTSSQFIKDIRKQIYTNLPADVVKELINKLSDDKKPVLNIEHAVPMSLFGRREYLTNSPIYFDPHHMFLTSNKVNAYRENFPYGQVTSPTILFDESGFLHIDKDHVKNAYYDCKQTILYTCISGKCVKADGQHYNCDKNVKEIDPKADKTKFTALDNSDIFEYKIRVPLERDYFDCRGDRCIIEPMEKQKGIIARAVLYVYLVYIIPFLKHKYVEHYPQYFKPPHVDPTTVDPRLFDSRIF